MVAFKPWPGDVDIHGQLIDDNRPEVKGCGASWDSKFYGVWEFADHAEGFPSFGRTQGAGGEGK